MIKFTAPEDRIIGSANDNVVKLKSVGKIGRVGSDRKGFWRIIE